ncbi:Acyl carrier protein [Streptomyces tendae]
MPPMLRRPPIPGAYRAARPDSLSACTGRSPDTVGAPEEPGPPAHRLRARRAPTKEVPDMPSTADERQLLDELRQLLAATVEDLTVEEIEPDSSLQDDLGVDSLARLGLVAAIEDRWQIQVPQEQADRLTTVREIAAHLAAAVAAPTGGTAPAHDTRPARAARSGPPSSRGSG